MQLIQSSTAHDRYRETKKQRSAFERVRRTEETYRSQLLKVARQIGALTKMFAPGDPNGLANLDRILRQYARDIEPWARSTAAAMLADVSRRDERAWKKLGDLMGREMRREIYGAPTGRVMQGILEEQVSLITSLPLEAAQRVHRFAAESLITGARASDLEEAILSTGHVSASRARLIARTEVGRSMAAITEARATFAGIETYIWRTAGDSDVRPDHKRLNGKVFRWDSPPIADRRTGTRSNPGAIYNCRCFPEPVIT